MGQENEQQAEMIATIQHEHGAMKAWYNNHSHARALHRDYGTTYPSFWRDVVTWKGWKDARKLYLKSIEGKASSGSTSGASGDINSTSVPRKRKSRWASAGGDGGSNATSDPPKRKSRWARGRDPTPAPAPGTNSVLDLLPGLPNKLSATQSSELSGLQKTLRECNAKLANLESEAARIDALPIGHNDRSPSPPPVYGPDGKGKIPELLDGESVIRV